MTMAMALAMPPPSPPLKSLDLHDKNLTKASVTDWLTE